MNEYYEGMYVNPTNKCPECGKKGEPESLKTTYDPHRKIKRVETMYTCGEHTWKEVQR